MANHYKVKVQVEIAACGDDVDDACPGYLSHPPNLAGKIEVC